MDNVLLFNPVSTVHDRNVKIFKRFLPDYKIRCIYNSKLPWFADKKKQDDTFYFVNGHVPKNALKSVKSVILFTAQPRVPPCNLILEATLQSIPVIAIEEVYQLMFEQGYINNYLLPVDHLFVASEYERDGFIKTGVSPNVVETTGCIFRYKQYLENNSIVKEELRQKLNLPANKPVITISLGYLLPSGESHELRKYLFSSLNKWLPAEYEFVIKLHPAENDKDVYSFIKKYAPRAKVASPGTPIEGVLELTDILINRGNSQVIIDALQKDIPVIVIPMGRKTLFHGVLDEVVVDDIEKIGIVLDVIKQKGFSIYRSILKDNFSITPEEALNTVVYRIKQIADNVELYKPEERLTELALFWALMGYNSKGLKVLDKLRNSLDGKKEQLRESIYRLISYKASCDDLVFLREWSNKSYREWLIQSLWIKCLYLKSKSMSCEDKELVLEFPPRMSREYFINYICMLGWCYLKSGLRTNCELLIKKNFEEYSFLKEVRQLKILSNADKKKGIHFQYCYYRFKFLIKTFLKNVRLKLKV